MSAFQLSLERQTIWTKRFKHLGAAAGRSARYVDRNPKGADPSRLPVEQPDTFELHHNLRKAFIVILLLGTSPVMAYSWVDHRGYYHQRGLPSPGVYPRHHTRHHQTRLHPHYARYSRPRIERVRVGRRIVMIIPDDTKFVPIADPVASPPNVNAPPMGPARTVDPYGTLDNVRFSKPNDVDTKLFKPKEPSSAAGPVTLSNVWLFALGSRSMAPNHVIGDH